MDQRNEKSERRKERRERKGFPRFRFPPEPRRDRPRRYDSSVVFRGLRFDVPADHYHTEVRDYCPALQAWLQTDPVGFAGGSGHCYPFAEGDEAEETPAD